MKDKLDQFELDRMWKNLDNWRGPFYFCRKDPRILVPKIGSPYSWEITLNCANPYTYIIIIGIVLIAVFSKHLF